MADYINPLREQLQEVVNDQTTAVRQLGHAFGSVSMVEASFLGGSLKNAVANSARANDLTVRLKFEPGHVILHRSLFDALSEALDELLRGVVAYTIPAASELKTPVTITVAVQQSTRATIIEVSDTGCGVTVKGAERRSDNPWRQVTKPDWREIDPQQRIEHPTVWSRQIDHQVDVSGLIDIATKFGGSVAICSDESGSSFNSVNTELKRNSASTAGR